LAFFEKGIQMKRVLAFALIAAIGMFVIGCGGGGNTTPPAEQKQGSFTKGAGDTKTPAAPGADKKP